MTRRYLRPLGLPRSGASLPPQQQRRSAPDSGGRRMGRTLRFCMVAISIGLADPIVSFGQLAIEHAVIRQDQYPLAVEDFLWAEGWGEMRQFFPRYFKCAATVHVFVRNDGDAEAEVTQLSFNGRPIGEVCTTAEFAGPVHTVPGSPTNRKITFPHDMITPEENQ